MLNLQPETFFLREESLKKEWNYSVKFLLILFTTFWQSSWKF